MLVRNQYEMEEIYRCALRDIDSCGIEHEPVAEVKPNPRLSRAFARCLRVRNGFRIEYNPCLTLMKVKRFDVQNIFAHEILHTCRDSQCHTGEWKRNAAVLMRHYPQYHIARTADCGRIGLKTEEMHGKYERLLTERLKEDLDHDRLFIEYRRADPSHRSFEQEYEGDRGIGYIVYRDGEKVCYLYKPEYAGADREVRCRKHES